MAAMVKAHLVHLSSSPRKGGNMRSQSVQCIPCQHHFPRLSTSSTISHFKPQCIFSANGSKLQAWRGQPWQGPPSLESAPEKVDWREAIMEIRNQDEKYDCVPHAIVASMESLNYLQTGEELTLSVREVFDCVSEMTSEGIDEYGPVFDYVGRIGVALADEYPDAVFDRYRSPPICRNYLGFLRKVYLDGFAKLPPGNEAMVKIAVAQQPLIVEINKDRTIDNYQQGIHSWENNQGHYKRHSMLLVGYDTSASGEKYWILLNFRGIRWGMKGFMYHKREMKQFPMGLCNILSNVAYPIMNGKISSLTKQLDRMGLVTWYPENERISMDLV